MKIKRITMSILLVLIILLQNASFPLASQASGAEVKDNSSKVILSDKTPANGIKKHSITIRDITESFVEFSLEGNIEGQVYFQPTTNIELPNTTLLITVLETKPIVQAFGFSNIEGSRFIIDVNTRGSGARLRLPVKVLNPSEPVSFYYGFVTNVNGFASLDELAADMFTDDPTNFTDANKIETALNRTDEETLSHLASVFPTPTEEDIKKESEKALKGQRVPAGVGNSVTTNNDMPSGTSGTTKIEPTVPNKVSTEDSIKSYYGPAWTFPNYVPSYSPSYVPPVSGGRTRINFSFSTASKDILAIALRVIEGEFANGTERVKRLTDAGYDYKTVQAEVNRLLGLVTEIFGDKIPEEAQQIDRNHSLLKETEKETIKETKEGAEVQDNDAEDTKKQESKIIPKDFQPIQILPVLAVVISLIGIIAIISLVIRRSGPKF